MNIKGIAAIIYTALYTGVVCPEDTGYSFDTAIYAGFWQFDGDYHHTSVTLDATSADINVIGAGTKKFPMRIISVQQITFVNLLVAALPDEQTFIHFVVIRGGNSGIYLIGSRFGIKERVELYRVDMRHYTYATPIPLPFMRRKFCSEGNDSSGIITEFVAMNVDTTTDLGQYFFLIMGEFNVLWVGKCTASFILIRSTGEIFPMNNSCESVSSLPFYLVYFPKIEWTGKHTLVFELRMKSSPMGTTINMGTGCQDTTVVHEDPEIPFQILSSNLQVKPSFAIESADTLYTTLSNLYAEVVFVPEYQENTEAGNPFDATKPSVPTFNPPDQEIGDQENTEAGNPFDATKPSISV